MAHPPERRADLRRVYVYDRLKEAKLSGEGKVRHVKNTLVGCQNIGRRGPERYSVPNRARTAPTTTTGLVMAVPPPQPGAGES